MVILGTSKCFSARRTSLLSHVRSVWAWIAVSADDRSRPQEPRAAIFACGPPSGAPGQYSSWVNSSDHARNRLSRKLRSSRTAYISSYDLFRDLSRTRGSYPQGACPPNLHVDELYIWLK